MMRDIVLFESILFYCPVFFMTPTYIELLFRLFLY